MVPWPSLDVASVAADRAALVRFARSLLADEAVQEDVVQDAWVAALDREVGVRAHRLPWMMVVLRNLVHRVRRDRLRRQAREEAFHSRCETAAPSADEALERLETQRRLVDAVQRLDEPFRSTVLWVYFEGLSPSDLARRSGVPAGTVRWRLKTALNRVRRALAEGGDRNWRPALTLFALQRPPVVLSWPTVLAMKASTKGVVAASILAIVLAVTFIGTRPGGPSSPGPRVPDPTGAPDERESPRALSSPIDRPSSLTRPAPPVIPPRFVPPGDDAARVTAGARPDRPAPTGAERRLAVRLDEPPDADELLRRAGHCELRWDVPGAKSDERLQSQGWATDQDLAALGLAEAEVEIARRAIARYKEALATQLIGALEELESRVERSPQDADVDALEARLMQLMAKLKPGEMRRARRDLAQELAGLRSPGNDTKRSLGERIYMQAFALARDFERDLAQEVGERRAAELRIVLSGRQSNVGCP
jgi:RNA polymerase sigma-70 factor (ECF subfamily)